MSLPNPKPGNSIPFQKYPNADSVFTLGNPVDLIWASIKHLCARDVINSLLKSTYNITDRKIRNDVAINVKIYIKHAYEFYETGKSARSNTAPLFYYYSFLNLGKALCEIKNPLFHKQRESYKHGISWKPNPDYLVNIFKESVFLNIRGVWHVLWESISNNRCLIPQQLNLPIIELFSFCPEISDEFERTTDLNSKLINLINPFIIVNESDNEIHIRFSVSPNDLKYLRLSRANFIKYISFGTIPYHQVKSDYDNIWTFEFKDAINYDPNYRGEVIDLLKYEIKALNLFASLNKDGTSYSIALQDKLPLTISQLMILYTLLFWLGSLVRYDPHSVEYLQESECWILIEGFMNQSIIWLLELFEWEFYQWETVLQFSR
ncbi:MAG: YaaC family protein [Thermodesulfobacteriota bacterium]